MNKKRRSFDKISHASDFGSGLAGNLQNPKTGGEKKKKHAQHEFGWAVAVAPSRARKRRR